MRVPAGLGVAVGRSVCVAEGASVALGGESTRDRSTGIAVGEKICCATGSPNRADATVEESKTSARSSHCQPASM